MGGIIMKENKEIFAKVFYTPVNEPQNIRSIEVTSEKDYMQIENFIKGNTKKKRNPNLLDYESSGIKSSITDDFLKKSFIEVTEEDCKKLFEYFSMRMYTRSKESIRYWSVVVNDEFIFVYHFSPEKGFTFEENKIREFIKYLDKSTLLRFLFISQKKKVLEYIDSEKVDIDKKSDDKRMICAYEKQCSKGFQELLAGQPVYESKGDLKIRVKYSESTDVIIETDVDDIESINSNISIDFDEMNATVELKNAPIMEIEIAGKKYKAVENDSEIIRYRIKYEQLKIRRILEDVQWLIKENSQQEEIEEDAKKMGAEGKLSSNPIANLMKRIQFL